MSLPRQIPNSRKDHLFVLSTGFVLIFSLLNFIPWALLFVKSHFLFTFYALILLPLPVQIDQSLQQTNAFTNTVSGNINTGFVPMINDIVDCLEGARLLWNAIVDIVRGMLHDIAVNFYPINRNTIFNIVKNVLNLVLYFATMILNFLIDFFGALFDLINGQGFNFDFVVVIVKLILADLMDVLDDPPCFHPLSLLPGIFMHCLDNDLSVSAVNNGGFTGFMKAVCIVICNNGTMQSDLITDILLPCTGLDAFFIFKDIYFNIVGNVTNHYNDQITRFNARVAAFEAISTRVANAGPAIIRFIIRKICGGIAFFCKILGGLGIPTRAFNKALDHAYLDSSPTATYYGVCIYKGSNEQGEFVGCYYSDPAMGGARNSTGGVFDFDAFYDQITQLQKYTNDTMELYRRQIAALQVVQDTVVYNTNIINNPILNNIQRIEANMTRNITITNSYYGTASRAFTHAEEARRESTSNFHFKKSRMDANYERAQAAFEFDQHIASRNRSISTIKTLALLAHHSFKAFAVGLSALKHHRDIENVYQYTRAGLVDIGFNFSEIADAIQTHTETHYPSLAKESFDISFTLDGVIMNFVLIGISSLSSAFILATTLLYGVIGFMLMAMGTFGGLINVFNGQTSHYDLGLNTVVTPVVDWSGIAAHQSVSQDVTSAMVLQIMNSVPVILEISVLQIIRTSVMCYFPIPAPPLTCPPEIPMTVNQNTYTFDTTINYIINLTMCAPDPCYDGTFSEFGAPCINNRYNCWGNIPKFSMPSLSTTYSPNVKECSYNGTRFADRLPWYNYPINWLKYSYTDGLQFVSRIVIRGYFLPFLLIPLCYFLGKLCFCLKYPMSFVVWLTAMQYFIIPFHLLSNVCPRDTLFGLCNWYHSYITFPNGAPDSDDYFCFLKGAPTFYLGYVISLFVIEFIFFVLLGGILWQITFDILIALKTGLAVVKEFAWNHRNDPKYITLKKSKMD